VRTRAGSRYLGGPGPTSLDLRGGTLAFAWDYVPRSNCRPGGRSEPLGSELWLGGAGERSLLIKRGCEPDAFRSPSLLSTGVFTFATRGETRFEWLYGHFDGAAYHERGAPDGLVSLARDERASFYVARSAIGYEVHAE